MHWTDDAIILSSRKHGENNALVRVISPQHGVYAGMVRAAHSKTNRGIFQPGNAVSMTWQARLHEHLGTFKGEMMEANAAHIMQDAMKTAVLNSSCALLETLLPERHPYLRLYEEFHSFINILRTEDIWFKAYIHFEQSLLAECGFGLDLESCAATGTHQDLVYVSPKSGRAVSREAGQPYAAKLLPLPQFLLDRQAQKRVESAEILEGLQLTSYFLEHWLATPHGKKLPAARQRLVKLMKEQHGVKV